MADKTLFASRRHGAGPAPDTRNAENAPAYAFDARHALAQLAVTGCFRGTFYASAEAQLDEVLALVARVDDAFVARCAIHARRHAHMKDMPALLVAVLAARRSPHLAAAFRAVVDNGRMLRNVVQIVRSGVTGRRSLGSAPRRLVREWLAARPDRKLLADSVGSDPSLADIVKMVHPRPASAARRAFYGWLIGKEHDEAALPQEIRDLEAYRAGATRTVPEVPFQLLTSLPLTADDWRGIARNAPWQATRMNLATFARRGVFTRRGLFDRETARLTRQIAARLADPEAVRTARVLPYQLLAAYRNAGDGVPRDVVRALHRALELATANVPRLAGKVVVCPDVSGSMQSPVTGVSRGATSTIRCVDVAALIAAVVLRQGRDNIVLPFDWDVRDVALDPERSVLANADALAKVGGGGTAVSSPLRWLNAIEETADLVILVSDNQSWFDMKTGWGRQEATAAVAEWETFRRRNPSARLVCLDIQPYTNTQVPDRDGVLNIGGFSDAVFDVIARFAAGDADADSWVRTIESVPLDTGSGDA